MILDPPSRIQEGDFLLQTISEEDLENLRIWKNSNRKSFFYQNEITPEQQMQWFESFRIRPEDWMFIVSWKMKPFGCVGARLLEREWDIYNVIRGERVKGSEGGMRWSMEKVIQWIQTRKPDAPIQAKVLKTNPAKTWYQKMGFEEIGIESDYYLISWKNL